MGQGDKCGKEKKKNDISSFAKSFWVFRGGEEEKGCVLSRRELQQVRERGEQ